MRPAAADELAFVAVGGNAAGIVDGVVRREHIATTPAVDGGRLADALAARPGVEEGPIDQEGLLADAVRVVLAMDDVNDVLESW
jgi:hypothetical protein